MRTFPRLPSIHFFTFIYLHVWLHESIDGNVVARNETVCDDSGEDPTYSRYISVYLFCTFISCVCFILFVFS
jgi:hypothetical protein